MITPGEVSDQFQCKRRGGDASLFWPGTSEKQLTGAKQRYNYLAGNAISKSKSGSRFLRKFCLPKTLRSIHHQNSRGRLEGIEVHFPQVGGKKVSLGPAAIKNQAILTVVSLLVRSLEGYFSGTRRHADLDLERSVTRGGRIAGRNTDAGTGGGVPADYIKVPTQVRRRQIRNSHGG